MRRYDPISCVFYTCSTQPPIPETLDFIGFSDGLEDQELYVFSPSVLPKIQGMFLCPFFSCFQRKLLEISFGNNKKFPKCTSGIIYRKVDDIMRNTNLPLNPYRFLNNLFARGSPCTKISYLNSIFSIRS